MSLYYPALPNTILLWKALREWYKSVSKIPATVNTPPIMAQMLVAKWPRDLWKDIYLIKNVMLSPVCLFLSESNKLPQL